LNEQRHLLWRQNGACCLAAFHARFGFEIPACDPRCAWDDCVGCSTLVRWRDWPLHLLVSRDLLVGRPILVYVARVPYDIGTDSTKPFDPLRRDHRIGANAINLVGRQPHGYRVGPGDWTVPSSFCATGGPAAWLAGGWPMHPEKHRPWRDGRQAPRMVPNALAGYRDQAVVEVSA